MPTLRLMDPTYRAIPSRYPPISTFGQVSTPEDLEAVMELEGWTNDRLAEERLRRLPRGDWVFGTPNASIVMASFLHSAVAGLRFSGSELGAWYASMSIRTALLEVAHHLRREAVLSGMTEIRVQYRTYSAMLQGEYEDIRSQQPSRPDLYDPADYSASQIFGEEIRRRGDGIVYDSIRHAGGVNVVAYRPQNIQNIAQLYHYELTVPITGRIIARQFAA
jgi:hypothetical protein